MGRRTTIEIVLQSRVRLLVGRRRRNGSLGQRDDLHTAVGEQRLHFVLSLRRAGNAYINLVVVNDENHVNLQQIHHLLEKRPRPVLLVPRSSVHDKTAMRHCNSTPFPTPTFFVIRHAQIHSLSDGGEAVLEPIPHAFLQYATIPDYPYTSQSRKRQPTETEPSSARTTG